MAPSEPRLVVISTIPSAPLTPYIARAAASLSTVTLSTSSELTSDGSRSIPSMKYLTPFPLYDPFPRTYTFGVGNHGTLYAGLTYRPGIRPFTEFNTLLSLATSMSEDPAPSIDMLEYFLETFLSYPISRRRSFLENWMSMFSESTVVSE